MSQFAFAFARIFQTERELNTLRRRRGNEADGPLTPLRSIPPPHVSYERLEISAVKS